MRHSAGECFQSITNFNAAIKTDALVQWYLVLEIKRYWVQRPMSTESSSFWGLGVDKLVPTSHGVQRHALQKHHIA